MALVGKKPHSGNMLDVSHPTESAPPDDRRPNFQAASDESILTEKNDESEGYWT